MLEITTRVRLIQQMVEITKVVAHSEEGGIIALFASGWPSAGLVVLEKG